MSHKHPPGPTGHWLWGNLSLLRSDIFGLLEQVPQQYGGIASLRIAAHRVLLLSDPRWVEQVLVTDNRIFQKSPRFRRIVRTVFGNGLFVNQGATWLAQRRTVQSALDRIPLDRHCENVIETARRTLSGWGPDGETELEPRMTELAFAIRARTTLGMDQTDSIDTMRQCLSGFMDFFADRIRHPFSPPLWVPTPENQRIRSTINHWREFIAKLVLESQCHGEAPDDLLGSLLELGRQSEQALMPQNQLRDEIATWLLTGTETLANTFCWTWYLLANHPSEQDRLYQEVDSVLQGKTATRRDLESLKYTQCVLKESMRLYPQAYIIGRKAVAPFTMGEFKFPKGTTVILNQWFIGRDARWFADPLKFDPGRWNDAADPPSKFAYFPFGGGPRFCAGKTLAMMEMPLVMATLAQHFKFEMASTAAAPPQPSLTLRPTPGMRARFVRK
jgi:cytochrome P450